MSTAARRRAYPPSQARSRETLRRLLDAAEAVLARQGLEGATLPRIARKAGVSPATVYRRFRDKDALMREVFSRISGMAASGSDATPAALEQIRQLGIRAFARQWVNAMVSSFRANRRLMQATIRYSRQHADASFIRRQRQIEAEHFQRSVKVFLLWKDEIRHPNPELAIGYGMVIIAQALIELIVFDHATLIGEALPLSDDELRQELPRMLLRHLGVAEEAIGDDMQGTA